MSLVAAIAVAGVTSASAKDLSEAIKGVDISGTVVYRYDDKKADDASTAAGNYYKIGTTIKAPVNDDVTATTRFLVADDTGNFADGDTSKSGAGLDTSSSGDVNVGVTLSWVNFTYTGIANTTVTVGKQGIGTPWTNAVDSDGSEQTGTGILAASKLGPVTAVAAYFNQTNLDTIGLGADGDNAYTVALLASFAGVNAEAWYLDVQDTGDTYFLAANTSFDLGGVKLGLDGKYTSLDLDSDNKDYGNWELGVTAKMGMFNAGIAYAENLDDGDAIFNSVAKNGQIGYSVNLNNSGGDAEMLMVDLGMQVTPELHVGLNYDEVDAVADADDHEEAFVQVTYKMSKNLMTYVRFADGEENNVDYNRGRLQVQYSF